MIVTDANDLQNNLEFFPGTSMPLSTDVSLVHLYLYILYTNVVYCGIYWIYGPRWRPFVLRSQSINTTHTKKMNEHQTQTCTTTNDHRGFICIINTPVTKSCGTTKIRMQFVLTPLNNVNILFAFTFFTNTHTHTLDNKPSRKSTVPKGGNTRAARENAARALLFRTLHSK